MSKSTRNARKHAAHKLKRDAMLKATLPTIDNWKVMDDYFEANSRVLHGYVYNDARYEDGHFVETSPLRRIDHLTAITSSGTKYRLGTPSEEYLAHRKKEGLGPIATKVFRYERPAPAPLTKEDVAFMAMMKRMDDREREISDVSLTALARAPG